MGRHLRHAAVPAFILACLLLGGSPQGIWRNLLLQLLAIGLLGWALLARRGTEPTRAGRLLLLFAGLWFAILLLQLLPLPPSLWAALPGRGPVVESFALRGAELPWLPLSLTPSETAAALPIMTVPVAVIAAMLWLGAYRSRWTVWTLVAGTLLSILLGALQLVQGRPYLYPIHNDGAAGLFANSNHQGTLLLATIPFLAAVIGKVLGRGRAKSKEGLSHLLIAIAALGVLLVGLLLNGSLAALLLLFPVVLASAAIALPSLGRARPWLGALAGLSLLVGAAGLAWLSKAGSDDTSITTRQEIYANTLAAIGDTFPVGTGVGSFDRYYRLYEEAGSVDRFFINHAHSDPLEWVLETGLAGALLLLAFLAWWLRHAFRIWRGGEPDHLALAGTVGVAAILGHSMVDYPLRDAAIQAVFALCLALMVDPRSHAPSKSARRAGERSARHLSLDDDVPFTG